MAAALRNRPFSPRRPHVHELDRLRIGTAISVVIVHVLMFSMFVEHTALGNELQSVWVAIFHFTRELFVFVTGFALVYVYFGRRFDWRYFWRRRGIGVLLPYVLWSVIYTVVNHRGLSLTSLAGLSAFNIVTGSASYQLYYILMTLQFYLLLPAFLWFLGRVRQHPWIVLGVSFALNLAFLFWDYQVISGPNAGRTPLILNIYTYQERFVLPYQFYFILGGMAALYLEPIRRFLAKHGRWLLWVGVLGFAANLVYALAVIFVWRVAPSYAYTPFQPILAVYSTGLVLAFGYLAYRSVQRSPAGADPRLPRSRWWAALSDASFGIYLVHPLFLREAQGRIVPLLTGVSPWLILTFLCVFTCVASTVATLLLLRTPLLSRTVGREGPARQPRRASEPQHSPQPHAEAHAGPRAG